MFNYFVNEEMRLVVEENIFNIESAYNAIVDLTNRIDVVDNVDNNDFSFFNNLLNKNDQYNVLNVLSMINYAMKNIED